MRATVDEVVNYSGPSEEQRSQMLNSLLFVPNSRPGVFLRRGPKEASFLGSQFRTPLKEKQNTFRIAC